MDESQPKSADVSESIPPQAASQIVAPVRKPSLISRVRSRFGISTYILPLVLIIMLPVMVFSAQQRQETQSKASAATILSFAPDTSRSNPLVIQKGDIIILGIMVDPGTNIVSSVRLRIRFDDTKMTYMNQNGFTPSDGVKILSAPEVTKRDDKDVVTVVLSTRPTTTKSEIATIRFRATERTAVNDSVSVIFGGQTAVTSVASDDQFSENVLSSTVPAFVRIIGSQGNLTPTPPSQPGPTLTPTPIPTLPASTATTSPVVSACSACASDVNNDKRVTDADYSAVTQSFTTCYRKSPLPATCSKYDIDRNGTIDEFDLNCVKRNMNASCTNP
jgi:hypothetical protein